MRSSSSPSSTCTSRARTAWTSPACRRSSPARRRSRCPGPTTNAVAELAKQYNMYVICPIREQAGDREYNTAVLIDRKGEVAGYYRKVFVFWGEGVHCSTEGVKVFETDFGRIWHPDVLRPELPRAMAAMRRPGRGHRLLAQRLRRRLAPERLWPSSTITISSRSARATSWTSRASPSSPSKSPARSSSSPRWTWTARSPTTTSTRRRSRRCSRSTRARSIVERKLSDEDLAPWWLFRATKPGVRTRDILKEHKIETLREYQHRSRKQINEAREKGERV